MMKIILIFACISSLLGCVSLKEQYESRSGQIKEYCETVFKDAGYKEKISKRAMAKCLSQTEDREQIKAQLLGIGLQLALIGIFGITIKASSF